MVELRQLSDEDRKKHAELHKDDGCVVHGSKDRPIAVEERHHDAGQYISWEYNHVFSEIGRKAKTIIQSLLVVDGKSVDRLLFEAEDGSRHVYYFDVSAQLDGMTEQAAKAAMGEPVGNAPAGPRTRFIVIWHPGFEKGMSRMQTIQTLKMGWTMKAPEMAARREVVTRDTPNQEVLRRVDEWLLNTWGKTLGTRKRISVVLISDPVWEDDKNRFEMSVQALAGGYSAGGREKPQFCCVGVEAPEGI